ncbi:MAG: hypothetical protein AB8E15_01045 [Bdellovibrionales bacterium]
MVLQKGFNDDLSVGGTAYHIQTEDWGLTNPFVVTRVYVSGAVVRSVKRCYRKALELRPEVLAEAIQAAMKEQHSKILDLLETGQLN